MAQHWKRVACSPQQEQILYREWGLFYTKKQNLDVADNYYNKSLALNADDPKALYFRSMCKRNIAKTAEALGDSNRALDIDPMRQPFNLEVCDGFYEMNEFEKTKWMLSKFSRKFVGKKVQPFVNRMDVIDENFGASLGDTLGEFILQNRKKFDRAYQDVITSRNIDKRPLWKIMKEQEKCDVLSIPEIKEIILSPREIARRKRAFARVNQIYFKRAWNDVLFLKALRTNESLLLPQSNSSRPILEILTDTKYDVIMKLLRMLNARSPLYTENKNNCPNEFRKKQQSKSFLFRVQNQVHRSALKMLATMRNLRANGRVEKLRNYIEEIMGEYVVLKTKRVMPLKFQFTNEVYNILALAQCDQYTYDLNKIAQAQPKDQLLVLFHLQTEAEKEPVPVEFGNRATFQNEDLADKQSLKLKALLARFSKRLLFAKFPIERAYLYYEIARIDLKQNNFDRCCLTAEKCLAEADRCNSLVWKLHAVMLICQAHALLRKLEKIEKTLNMAMQIAARLNSKKLNEFLRFAMAINAIELRAKKLLDRRNQNISRASLHSGGKT